VRAVTVVDGERLESQDFELPPDVGVVLLLTATDKTAQQEAAKAAVPGEVVIGGQSRIVLQMDDDVLQVFYLFEIVNSGGAPVKPPESLVFDMPNGAQGTTVLEGSTPLAIARGQRVTVDGPFTPGTTSVQIAATLPSSGEASIDLRLPARLSELVVIAEKAGALVLRSPQIRDMREMNDQGKRVLVANGPGLAAGDTISLQLSGIPRHASWPRNLALALAIAILAAGVWAAARTGGVAGEAAARKALESRREQLLARVAKLEADRAADGVDEERYADLREELMSDLERVYGELDTSAFARADQGLSV
jgi:hypothetical protein